MKPHFVSGTEIAFILAEKIPDDSFAETKKHFEQFINEQITHTTPEIEFTATLTNVVTKFNPYDNTHLITGMGVII